MWRGDELRSLESTTQIVDSLQSVEKSPVFDDSFSPEDWLGDLTYDADGRIISAKAAKMLYILEATTVNVLTTNVPVSINTVLLIHGFLRMPLH